MDTVHEQAKFVGNAILYWWPVKIAHRGSHVITWTELSDESCRCVLNALKR